MLPGFNPWRSLTFSLLPNGYKGAPGIVPAYSTYRNARRPQTSSGVFTSLATIFRDDVVQEPHKQLITMAALKVDDKNEGQLSLSSLSSPQSETDDGPSGRGQC